jgi:hypothetical protein
MTKMLKKFLSKVFQVSIKFYNNTMILKKEFGQYKTIKKNLPINRENEPIPWYTYPAIEFLSQFDYSTLKLLEFGMGNSSIFWSKRCKHITCIEHRKEWFEQINLSIKPSNTSLFLKDENTYTDICENGETFDIVIIDGIKRTECAKNISKCLKFETGMVILDNSDWYPETSEYLRNELKLNQIDFFGFGPINNYTWCTSIFLGPKAKLNPLNRQPAKGIGALNQICDND